MDSKRLICVHSPPRTASRSMRSYFHKIGYDVDHHHTLIDRQDNHFKPVRADFVIKGCTEYWEIVSIVRDPIERNLSYFWHTSRMWKEKTSQEEFVFQFLQAIDHYRAVKFIEREIEPFWRTPIYAHKDSLEFENWAVFDDRLLIVRFDKLNECINEAVSELLNKEVKASFPLQGKSTYDERFKDLKLPTRYVGRMLNNPFVEMFFTKDEIGEMWQRWAE